MQHLLMIALTLSGFIICLESQISINVFCHLRSLYSGNLMQKVMCVTQMVEVSWCSDKLKSHFLEEGVIHLFSCPYTPQQSGLIERRHRSIAEIGLTQVSHCHAPLDF